MVLDQVNGFGSENQQPGLSSCGVRVPRHETKGAIPLLLSATNAAAAFAAAAHGPGFDGRVWSRGKLLQSQLESHSRHAEGHLIGVHGHERSIVHPV
jgi:hypothetical protein